MLRFLLGFVLAVATVALAGYLYLGKRALTDACLDRCADGTRCAGGRCIPSFAEKPPAPEPKPGRRRKRGSAAAGGIGGGAAEPEKKLLPGDERSSTSGDALGRPEHIDMSQGGDDKELAQGDIDRVWAGAEPGLSHCITEAVADWPLDSGKIEVSYRIEKDGSVKKVRLTALQLLMRNGLYACMRAKITGLHFPRSGGASVVTFPFALQ